MKEAEAHPEKAKIVWKTFSFTLVLTLFGGILLIAVAIILGIYFWPLHPKPVEIVRESANQGSPSNPSAYTDTDKDGFVKQTIPDIQNSNVGLKGDDLSTESGKVVTNLPDLTDPGKSFASTEKNTDLGNSNQWNGQFGNDKEPSSTTEISNGNPTELITLTAKPEMGNSKMDTVHQPETTTLEVGLNPTEKGALSSITTTTESTVMKDEVVKSDEETSSIGRGTTNAESAPTAQPITDNEKATTTVMTPTVHPPGKPAQTSTQSDDLSDFDSDFSKLVDELFGITPLKPGLVASKPEITHRWPPMTGGSASASEIPGFPPHLRIDDLTVPGFINSVFKKVDDQFREIERMLPPKFLFPPFRLPFPHGF